MTEPAQFIQSIPAQEVSSNVMVQILQAFDNYPQRIYVKDAERRFTYINRAMLEAAKRRNPQELLGRRDEDLFTSSHLQSAKHEDERIIQQGSSANLLEKMELETWLDGRLKWVWTTKIAIVKDGATTGIFGISREAGAPGVDEALQRLAGGQPAGPAHHLGVYYQPPPKQIANNQLERQKPYCDDAFLLSFPDRTVRGRFRFIHEDDRDSVRDFLKNAIQNDIPFNQTVEFRAQIRGGEYRWVCGHAVAWGLRPHRHLVVAHHDVTEQRVRESLGSRILEAFPGYVFVKDEQLRFKFMNARLLELLRRDLGEIRSKNDSELGFLEDEIRAFEEADWAVLASSSSEPIFVRAEALTIPSTKEKKRLITIKMPIAASVFEPWNQSPTARHILGLSWDITQDWEDMQKAVQAWRTLLALAHDAIYVKDRSLQYTEMNRPFMELTGKPESALLGHTADEVFAGQKSLLEEINAEDREILRTGKAPPQKLRVLQTKKGLRYGLSTKMPIKGEDGKTVGILGMSQDISDVPNQFLFDSHQNGMAVPQPSTKELVMLSWRVGDSAGTVDRLGNDPDVLIDLFDRYHEMLTKLTAKIDFRFDHLAQNRALVLFGAMDETDRVDFRVRQAARFACQFRKSFHALMNAWNAKWRSRVPFTLRLRVAMGIHVGRAVVAFKRVGRSCQVTTIGNATAVADRLAEYALRESSPQIIVSSTVRERLSEHYVMPRKPITISSVLPGYALGLPRQPVKQRKPLSR